MYRVGAVRALATDAAQAVKKTRVTIPPAIQRGPTDLLKAISSTVGVDPTAPHFAFIDDPTTIPTTAASKRNYYMAKEMGKRAARQLAEEWPTLFAFDRDVPRLGAFRPQKMNDPATVEPTEENLKKMVDARQVEDAGILYERIRAEDTKVSEEVQMALFRLVVYYNGKNVPFSEFEEWHGLRTFGESDPSRWTQAGLADLLYEVLPHNASVNSTMVSGLCKHSTKESVHRAKTILKEMKEAKVTPTVDAFNAMIGVSEWNESRDWLNQLKGAGLKPNLETFNKLMISANKIRKYSERVSTLQKISGEMESVGISPSLHSYHLLLRGASVTEMEGTEEKLTEKQMADNERKTTLAISWLSAILSRLEKAEKIEIQSVHDSSFFLTAIQLCQESANLDIAKDVVSLYESNKNDVRMPALTVESLFYNRYLMLFINRTSDIALVEKTYKDHVPRLVGVSRQLSMKVADRLKISPSWPLLFRLIEDGIASRQMIDVRVGQLYRELLLAVNYQNLSVTEREDYSVLICRMVDIWTEFSRFTEDYNRRMQLKMAPGMICESALLLTRIGQEERAWKLLETLLDPVATQGDGATVIPTGFARYNVLMELFEFALRNRDAVKAGTCLEILSAQLSRTKLEPLMQRIIDRCDVTPTQSKILQGFVRLRPQ